MSLEPMPEEPETDLIGLVLWAIVGVLGCIIFAQISVGVMQKLLG